VTELYRPRWLLLIALAAGVGALIGLTYLPSRPSADQRPARGGDYVEGVAGAPSVVNPLFAGFNTVDGDLTSLVFSGLVRLGANGAPEPDLAELPRITPDGRSYVFELRDGLRWHDGRPLTADDVVFTVRMIQDADFGGDPGLVELFEGVEVEASNERTVIFTLPEPFAPFLARGATVGILPEHLLGRLDAGELDSAPFNAAPIGSGPFRLTELTAEHAVLRPFEAYHFGAPFLERLELRFYRDDAELLTALEDAEIDGALLGPGLHREALADLDSDSSLVLRSLHGTAQSLVYLNLGVPAFQDAGLRRALQHGLDREALIEEVLGGQALPLDSPIVRDMWSHVGSEEAYRYDPAQAGRLLDRAGWTLDDAGARTQDGAPFRFRLAVPDEPAQAALAEAIAAQWGELGLQVDVEVSAGSEFVERVLFPRQFHAALVTIDSGRDPDPYPFWHSAQAIGEGRNLGGFSDPDVDRVLEGARQATSPAERAAGYRAFQEIFADRMPAVLLHTPTFQYVARAGVQGLRPGLLFARSARFADVQRWFVETAPNDDGG
jgi:peptide/nickel transport system substrate-binding protein